MAGRSKPVELPTRSFEEQGDATAFFKAMLNRYRPGERVSDEDGLDVAALLERHTEHVAKVGCGVSHFQVMMTEHGTMLPDHPHGWQRHGFLLSTLHLPETAQP